MTPFAWIDQNPDIAEIAPQGEEKLKEYMYSE